MQQGPNVDKTARFVEEEGAIICDDGYDADRSTVTSPPDLFIILRGLDHDPFKTKDNNTRKANRQLSSSLVMLEMGRLEKSR